MRKYWKTYKNRGGQIENESEKKKEKENEKEKKKKGKREKGKKGKKEIKLRKDIA